MRDFRRGLVLILSGTLGLPLAACGDDEVPVVLSYEELALTELGPYAVGFYRTELPYPSSWILPERTIPVLIWYPAPPSATGTPTELKIAKLMKIPGVRSMDELPVAGGGPFPLAIYSHGSGGEGVLAYPFAEQFASRGWVVVSPDHVGNTTTEMLGAGKKSITEMTFWRPLDIRVILDEAGAGFGLSTLEGVVDDQKTFVFGHSFGGFTSMTVAGAGYDIEAVEERACVDEDEPNEAFCELIAKPSTAELVETHFVDDRIRAIGLQAPATIGLLESSGVRVPALLLSGNRDLTTPDATAAEPIWAGLRTTGDLWFRFSDAGHYSFISMCSAFAPALVETFSPGAMNDGCGDDFLPVADVIRINTALLVAFAEKHVLGVNAWDDLLSGEKTLGIIEEARAEVEVTGRD